MVNLQLAEKAEFRENRALDTLLDVHSVFPTIQGEGPFAGIPAIFVRLAGCNLQCPACDTEYTQGRELMKSEALMSRIGTMALSGGFRLIVITGGEPFRQRIGPFVEAMMAHQWKVQVETNGTLWDEEYWPTKPFGLNIVCSPKTGKIHHCLAGMVDAYKYIGKADELDPNDGLPLCSLEFGKDGPLPGIGVRPARPPESYKGEVYLQPLDEGLLRVASPSAVREANAANLRDCIKSCIKFGYRLSIQTHKLAGLP